MSTGLAWQPEMRRTSLHLAVFVTQRCAGCGDWVTVTGDPGDAHGRLFGPRCRGALQGRRRYRARAFHRGTWIRNETLPLDIRARLQDLMLKAKRTKVSAWQTLEGGE